MVLQSNFFVIVHRKDAEYAKDLFYFASAEGAESKNKEPCGALICHYAQDVLILQFDCSPKLRAFPLPLLISRLGGAPQWERNPPQADSAIFAARAKRAVNPYQNSNKLIRIYTSRDVT